MISIIISSAQKQLLDDASKNIEATVGIPYELIVIDNSKGKMGICEVYNRGVKMAKYDLLCFMHEDIDIKTLNWGNEVLKIFREDPLIGIVGVVGCAYKTFAPSGWAAENKKPNTIFSNYLQSFKRVKQSSVHYYNNPDKLERADVVCVDGMWFCTLKDIAIQHPFDQELLTGFHCYDLDYCLNVSQNYKVVVTYKILMEHYSEGGYSEGWLQDTFRLHKKWGYTLPRSTVDIPECVKKKLEKRSFKGMLEKMIELNHSLKEMIRFLRGYHRDGSLNTWSYLKLSYYAMKFVSRKNKA